jgi:hypothetical protein
MELRELLQEFGYNAEETPIVIGSALCALEVVFHCEHWYVVGPAIHEPSPHFFCVTTANLFIYLFLF